jgi:phosphoglucosamine mutase
VLVNIPVIEQVADAAEQVAAEIAAVEAQLAGNGRVLLRPSGTEPLLRVMVEASDAGVATDAAEHLAAIVRARWGK